MPKNSSEPKKFKPILHIAMVAGGLYLLYIGVSGWVASRYIAQGADLSSGWYFQTIGSMISGLLLTIGPGLKAAVWDVLKVKFPWLPGGTPAPTPVPGPDGKPIVPLPGADGLIDLLLHSNSLNALLLQSPEASFLAVLALARYAKNSGNQSLLNSLRTTATTLFDTCFKLPEPNKDVPNVSPPAPALPITAL